MYVKAGTKQKETMAAKKNGEPAMSRFHQVGTELKKKSMRWKALLLFAAVLMVSAVLGLGAKQAQAAETGSKRTFALTMTTGVTSGTQNVADQIGFIRVKYTASDGSGTHYEYLFPGDGDFITSMQTAMSLGEKNNNGNADLSKLKELGYSITGYTAMTPFQAYSENTLLFSTIYDAKSFEGIEIYGKGNGEWNCQAMQLYEVDASKVRVSMAGTYSNQYYIDFTGECLLELTKPVTFRWTNSELMKVTTSGGKGTVKAPEGNEKDRKMGASEYVFRIDIADVYGAGANALASSTSTTIIDQGFLEMLALNVRYTDSDNVTREVNIPVITSALTEALAQEDTSVRTGKIVSVAQEGDTLVFTANLPGCDSIVSANVIYGYEGALAATGMQYVSGEKSTTANAFHNNTYNSLDDASVKDSLQVTGISVYSAENTTAKVSLQDEMLRATLTKSESGDAADTEAGSGDSDTGAEPLYYYKAQRTTGTSVEYGSQTNITFTKYEDGVSILPSDQTERYLIVLKTDSPTSAGTTGSLRLKLKYKDTVGYQQETNEMVLSEQCQNYYGYWPGVSSDFAYLAGVQSGGELYFLVELSNVDYFNGVDISLDSRNDDWQMSGMDIYLVRNLGKRGASDESVSAGGTSSDRKYFRTSETSQMLALAQTLLVQAGETQTLDIRSDNTSEVVDTDDDDWSDIKYSMSYEQAKSIKNFAKGRESYVVKVQVGGSQVTDTENGDCGSSNQFYFQLVFEDGTTSYVLANQQLSSDGFRTGAEETFTITANHDYGELTAVRIIPEDLDDKSDIFDKLNIESITVVKSSTNAVSKQWVVSNVGWIDIDYRDQGEEQTGRKGRSQDELARAYTVSYSESVVNLEFAVTTATYNAGDSQLQGKMTGVLTYRDSNGETQTQTIDLVHSMYEYMDRTPSSTSNTDYMFRGDHTDRFIVSVENPSEIISLKLNVNSTVQTTWNVKGVSVKLASKNSTLQLNMQNEYELVSDEEVISVCEQDSTKVPAYDLFCSTNTTDSLLINFNENQISIDDTDNGKSVSAISRQPQSYNDTLNVYVYMSDNADPVSNYTMKTAAQYTKVYGGVYQTSHALTYDSEKGMYYAKGLNASAMQTLNSLYIKADPTVSSGYPSALLKYAVVQRVRSGVVIETTRIDFAENNAIYGVSRGPDSQPTTSGEEQIVSLAFSEDTSDVSLTAEDYDVAVSIRYTTTLDPSGSKIEYNSPYIFLTDQQINAIKAGQTVDITFGQSYVEEITGVTLATTTQNGTENPKITINSAVAATYQVQTQTNTSASTGDGSQDTESKTRTLTGWYSFANAITLNNGEQTMQRTGTGTSGTGTVTELSLAFATANAEEGSNTGHSGKISMTIGYTNYDGANREITCDDIRSHLTSGSFNSGETGVVRLQIADISEVRWISITPKSDTGSGTGSWKISTVTGTLKAGDQESAFARTVDRYFTETEGGKINVNVRVSLTAQTTNSSGNVSTRNVTNDTAAFLVESGQPVTMQVNLTGSEEGFDVTAEEYDIQTDAGKTVNEFLSVDGTNVTFNTPANYTGANINYRVIVTSKETPSCKSVINVTVQFTDKPEETVETTDSSGETDANANSGSNANTNSNTNANTNINVENVELLPG